MNFTNLFRIAVKALSNNKLRGFLTMLGIIIGVASVITMLAIGQGSKRSIQAEISERQLQEAVGQTMPVLVDAPHDEWPGLHVGRVWFQAPEVDGITYVSGLGVAPGALVQGDIVESSTYDLTALA